MPDMPNQRDPSQNPLDLDAVDQEIRINELSEQVKELGMGESYVSEDCPPGVQEQFLKGIVDYESAPQVSSSQRLEKKGVPLPAPDSLDDGALTAKLWEVINALAEQSTYLHHTNHLSDRQLYEHLWSETLHEEMPCFPKGSGWTNHLDLIGSGSDEHIEIGHRYYDTEEDRQRWMKEFPDTVMPPHEDPPYDRDRLLPISPDEVRRLKMLAAMEAGEPFIDDDPPGDGGLGALDFDFGEELDGESDEDAAP